MGHVFKGLPADSAELQTLHGYFVYGPVAQAAGSSPPQPWNATPSEPTPPAHAFALPWPATVVQESRRTRVYGEPFPPNTVTAALLLVPVFCAMLVWLVGLMGR